MQTGIVLAIGVLLLVALVKQFTDFLKALTNALAGDHTQWNSVLTQLVAWAGAVGAVFLVGATQFASGVTIVAAQAGIPALTLDALTFWSKVVLGLGIGSGASLGFDWLKARDNTQSAAKPALIPSLGTPPAPPQGG